MRSDMGKVVTEAPRHGSDLPSKKYRKSIRWEGFDAEYEEPYYHSASARRQYGFHHREFSDVLGPLRRFINSCVGKRWDDIYSELSQKLSRNPTGRDHILTHVRFWVAVHAYQREDGLWVDKELMSHQYRDYGIVDGLYVHPITNIICVQRYTPRRRRHTKKVDNEILDPRDSSVKYVFDRVWYIHKFVDVKVYSYIMVAGRVQVQEKTEKQWKRYKQASKKELKHIRAVYNSLLTKAG